MKVGHIKIGQLSNISFDILMLVITIYLSLTSSIYFSVGFIFWIYIIYKHIKEE